MSLAARDILLRAGGRTLLRYGVPVRRLIPEDPINRSMVETFTRADATTCATAIQRDGSVALAAANTLRVQWEDLDGDGVRETPCLLLEGSRINVALYSRDLTNAAWNTKTSVTVLKDQTGVDGAANAASSILATGSNGVCRQAITLASSQRAQSAWVKRLVGSGTIEMTTDGGSTWTPITITASWVRYRIPAQTVTNPDIGFRLVTSGDKIAVDFVQNEAGPWPSSAIATTSASVTRATDALTLPLTFGPQDITVLYRLARPIWADDAGDFGYYPTILRIANTGSFNEIFFGQGDRNFYARTGASGSQASTSLPGGASLVLVSQHKNMTTAPAVAVDTGSGLTAFDTGAAAFTAYGDATVLLSTGASIFAAISDVIIARGLWSLTEMAAIP